MRDRALGAELIMTIAELNELNEPAQPAPRYLVRPPPGIVSREEFNLFRLPVTSVLVRDLTLIWVQASAGMAAYVLFPHWAVLIASLVVIGGAQHGLSQVAHEAAHRLVVPSSPRRNDMVGRWFFAAPVMIPFSLYRQRHFAHHRDVGTIADTKFLYRCRIKGFALLREIALSLSGTDYAKQVFSVLARFLRPSTGTEPAAATVSIVPDLVAIAVTQLAIASALTTFNVWYYPLLWVVPNMTWGMFFGKIRSMAEHQPLQADAYKNPGSPFFLETATPCLRSVRANWIERFLFSKVNFHYHSEHHLWPGISYQHLPKLQAKLELTSEMRAIGLCRDKSYTAILCKFFAGE
jgi:fatty acid desaturase